MGMEQVPKQPQPEQPQVPCSATPCPLEGKFKCGNCKTSNYCSKEHQKLHWKVHKHFCFPVAYGWDAVRGNELVATRDIAQGEVILKEKSISSGPSGKADVSMPICLGCNRVLVQNGEEKVQYCCSNCSWPLCGPDCEKAPAHAEFECPIFKVRKIPPFKHSQQYECLYILRCLLLKTLYPPKWEIFKKFESHHEERANNLMESLFTHAAIEFVRNTCGFDAEIFADDEVCYVAGVINTNAMGEGDFPGKAQKCGSHLYPLGCMICQSCTPNTYRVIQGNGDLHVRAIVPIKAGQPFLTTYTDLSQTTQERRVYLSTFYYFLCTCPRCSDPTELGTFFSAIVCPCKKGYLLPTNLLDTSTPCPWRCSTAATDPAAPNACTVSKEESYVSKLVEEIKEEWEGLPKGNTLNSVEALEIYLKKHKGVTLHPNHALIYRAEYDLIQRQDYMITASMIPSPAERQKLVKRQIDLVRKALELMSTFWAGYSSYRGRLLYFLQNALLRQTMTRVAQNMKENKRSPSEKSAVKEALNEIILLRKEAAKILIFDPVGRDEHFIAEKIQTTDSPEFQIAIKYCSV